MRGKFGISTLEKQMRNLTFWPCLFTFLIFFNQGFWAHEMKYLELDFEMKKPKSPPSMLDLFSLPPLNLPSPKEEPKEKMLDPKDGNTADDTKSNQSYGFPKSAGQS